MKIITDRFLQGTESTIGRLIVNDVQRGFILEDQDRGLDSKMSLGTIAMRKVYGRTAIPYGIYPVGLTVSAKFDNKLWPQLLYVPGYDGIRPHGGNFIKDTLGCQLPGKTYDQDKLGYYRVWESQKIFIPLKLEIETALHSGEQVTWEIKQSYKK